MRAIGRGGEVHDHTKSGQLRQRGRNRMKTETMMTMMIEGTKNEIDLLFLFCFPHHFLP